MTTRMEVVRRINQVLNEHDIAKAHGISVDPARLAEELREAREFLMDDGYSHSGTEYALEVGHDDETEGATFAEAFEEMTTPAELKQFIPGSRLVQRQWAVSEWAPVPAEETEEQS